MHAKVRPYCPGALPASGPFQPRPRVELTVFGVGSARWPDGPRQSGVAHGFGPIPVSGVGVVVGDEKMGGKGSKEQSTKT